MEHLTLEEILFTEECVEDVAATIRAAVHQGHEPVEIVNRSLMVPMGHMSRDDYAGMVAVMLWMLAKRDGPVAHG